MTWQRPARWAGLIVLFVATLSLKLAGLDYVSLTSHDNELLKGAYELVHHSRFMPAGDSFEFLGFGPVCYGPLHTYLVGTATLFSSHPYGPYVLLALLSSLATLLLYRLGRDFFGEAVGWLAAILYGFSGYVLFYSLDAYRTNFVPLFAILLFYSLYAVKVREKKLYTLAACASLALLLQLHISAFIASLIVGLFFLWRPKVGRGWLLGGLLCFAFFSLPWFLYETAQGFRDIRSVVGAMAEGKENAGEMEAGPDLPFVKSFLSPSSGEDNPFWVPVKLISFGEDSVKPEPDGGGRARRRTLGRRLCLYESCLALAGLLALLAAASLRFAGPRGAKPSAASFSYGFLAVSCFLSLAYLSFFPYHSILHFQFSFPLMILALAVFVIRALSLHRVLHRVGRPILFLAALFHAVFGSVLMIGAYRHCEREQTTFDGVIPYPLREQVAGALLADGDFDPAAAFDSLFAFRNETGVGLTQFNYIFFLAGERRERKGSLRDDFGYLVIRQADLPFEGWIRAEAVSAAGPFRVVKYPRLDRGAPWRFSDSRQEGWFLPGHDDSAWAAVPMPCMICLIDRKGVRCDAVGGNYESYFFRGTLFFEPGTPEGAAILQSSAGQMRLEAVYLNGRRAFERGGRGGAQWRESEAMVDLSDYLVPGENLLAAKFSGSGESLSGMMSVAYHHASIAYNSIGLVGGEPPGNRSIP